MLESVVWPKQHKITLVKFTLQTEVQINYKQGAPNKYSEFIQNLEEHSDEDAEFIQNICKTLWIIQNDKIMKTPHHINRHTNDDNNELNYITKLLLPNLIK